MIRPILAGAAMIAVPSVAYADDRGVIWSGVTAQGKVAGNVVLRIEGQWRLTDGIANSQQIVLRPAIGVELSPDSQILAGYAYFRTRSGEGRDQDEHRWWQQVQFPLLRDEEGRPILISRTRIEQRSVIGAEDTVWRLRQMIRLRRPLADGVTGDVNAELLWNANSGDWGQLAGREQWRGGANLSIAIAPRVQIEPGYMVQFVRRPGEDRINHVGILVLAYQL
ncbi:DUF2490 domain-containing protein [Sphingomonas sp. BGYR3]|uniref:DUF2490 domain-containing protein n=1 Tax=Sphingomonas sp. BGYR3 TaxID=2975483 RepID=UPI0021A6F3A3|nr:DUF2490 domain-containing protein [Sphingomonas sp. BGYR3]MDG5488234.1 DUF2490 domain-containing protein [Sphingomonas sp. BGYR3]